jgi:pyruvate dehydrogenase E2 component (dihydrolipoamide acetyltransferase)
MAEYIKMPTLGFDMEEGTMGSWLKEVGDPVKKGEVLVEIESDKVTQELTARAEGVLLATFVEPGDNIPVGANLGVIGEEGEDISSMTPDGEEGKEEVKSKKEEEPEEEPEDEAKEKPAQKEAKADTVDESDKADTAVSDDYPDGVKATPVARRVAEEHEVDLAQVSGSGPGGRIRKADVEAYLEAGPAEAEEAEEVKEAPVKPTAAAEEVPLTSMRRTIARRMTESKTTVPHFYVTTEVAMDEALALRKQINAKLSDEEKVTVNDLIVKAAALTLRQFPGINAAFAGDKIIRHKQINVGTAVAIEGGLLTVVQRDTDKATLSTIARDNKEMIGRAREGKITREDMDGSTFTVSNLGAFDVDHFIAIINPPDAAILAVGSAKKVPVVTDEGELAIGTRMKVTISADHRVTDGAEAAQFLQAFKGLLEEPLRLLI